MELGMVDGNQQYHSDIWASPRFNGDAFMEQAMLSQVHWMLILCNNFHKQLYSQGYRRSQRHQPSHIEHHDSPCDLITTRKQRQATFSGASRT
ncbi:hypothetical protein E4U51_008420 [Claviceps purpurea]|nr:hypothetical protein E4U51_008420 [Claviceps purpurea]